MQVERRLQMRQVTLSESLNAQSEHSTKCVRVFLSELGAVHHLAPASVPHFALQLNMGMITWARLANVLQKGRDAEPSRFHRRSPKNTLIQVQVDGASLGCQPMHWWCSRYIKLSSGFSIEKLPPARKTAPASSTERCRNMLPRKTNAWLSGDRSGRPKGHALDRKGGGPLSSFRAELKVL